MTHHPAARALGLNHVAMTVAPDELDRSVDEILAFYGGLFGWTGSRQVDEPGAPLLIRMGDAPAALYVYTGPERTGGRAMDHFGVHVSNEGEIDAVVEQARAHQQRDPRVEVIGKAVIDADDLEVVNCYVRFVLPLMVEVQHFRPKAGSETNP